VMQLEAQLADRAVSIELSEEATQWLIAHGFDEQMGARPMARTIQEHIKKPLADEVLFGKLKAGGHVRVIVVKDEGAEKLGFEYLDGPVTPKPELLPEPRRAQKKRRPSVPRRPKPAGPKGEGPRRGSVPKMPLSKVWLKAPRVPRTARRAAPRVGYQTSRSGRARSARAGTYEHRSMPIGLLNRRDRANLDFVPQSTRFSNPAAISSFGF